MFQKDFIIPVVACVWGFHKSLSIHPAFSGFCIYHKSFLLKIVPSLFFTPQANACFLISQDFSTNTRRD